MTAAGGELFFNPLEAGYIEDPYPHLAELRERDPAHPTLVDQLALLRDDPSLDARAIDELLRDVSPVQFSRRVTLEDTEFRGKVIPKGMFVLAGLAARNRDPEKWGPTTNDLDLTREGAGQHVSFGSGAHFCLGSSLAELEAREAIGRFVRRFPDAELAGEVEWNGRVNLRGLRTPPRHGRCQTVSVTVGV